MSEKSRRWPWILLLIAAVIAAILYGRCGLGLGVGGGDDGESDSDRRTPAPQPLTTSTGEVATAADAAPRRCQVRVDAGGITLAGAAVKAAEIPGRCPGGVVLTVTGDARYGDAEAVRAAVRDAGLDLLDRSP